MSGLRSEGRAMATSEEGIEAGEFDFCGKALVLQVTGEAMEVDISNEVMDGSRAGGRGGGVRGGHDFLGGKVVGGTVEFEVG